MSNKDSLKLGMTLGFKSKGKVITGTLVSTNVVVDNGKEYVIIVTPNNEQLQVPLKRCMLLLENTQEIVKEDYYKLYIIVRNDVPDNMVPVLVAHTILNANEHFKDDEVYKEWKLTSFHKVVVRSKDYTEYEQLVKAFPQSYEGSENTLCNGEPTCLIPCPVLASNIPSEFKKLKLWKPL